MTGAEGQHHAGYDPELVEKLISEAADLMRAIGFAAHHVVLIGGLVPGLLVPVLDPGIEPHIGTADIDLCLSLALVQGDTGTYERIETQLKRRGFEEGDASFRWVRRSGLPLTVEFFCPASDDRPPGRVFRPAAATNPTGKHNFGGHLSALALSAGELLTTDIEVITREVALPDNKGIITTELQVTGPLAFLVAKADALHGRDKPKDAYDIMWLVESWPGGPSAAAAAFAARAAYSHRQVQEGLRAIADAFSQPNCVGSRSYARFVADSPDEEPLLERRAVGAIARFMNTLPSD